MIFGKMGSSVQVFLLVFIAQIVVMAAETDPIDNAALNSIRLSWENLPSNWNNSDPCGGWSGIVCIGSRVTTLNLQGINVKGTEFGDISSLTALQYLDLSNNKGLKGSIPLSIGNLKNLTVLILVGCDFSGPIPEAIGSLQNLVLLSLNNNSFSGAIPPSIGKLSKLFRLDLDDNKLEGPIPVSNGNIPGLDLLFETRHFHFGSNKLSGPIPPGLFSSRMKLLHIVLDNNRLTGSLPSTVGLVQTLETIRVDSNSLDGPLPPNLNNLTKLKELYLANNKLTGSLPNLTGLSNLFYVDVSNNSFTPGDLPSWVTSLGSLISLLMEGTGITGSIPVELFSFPTLTTIVLSNNQLSGTLDVGTGNSNGFRLIDLQRNDISTLTRRPDNNTKLLLGGNPICNAVISTETYCAVPNIDPPASITPSPSNCGPGFCSSDKTLSPNCGCAVPYTGILHYIFYSFSNNNSTYFATIHEFLKAAFESRQLQVDSYTLTAIHRTESYFYRQFRLQVFPKGQETFNRTGVSHVGSLLNRQDFPNITNYYGPFYFTDESYAPFRELKKKSSNSGIIIGAAVGSSVLLLLLIGVGYYAYRQRKRVSKMIQLSNPFASWIPEEGSGGIPQLQGARSFSFEELVKYTDDFSEANCIGAGGYGKVYKGTLPSGQLIAIKRAQQGSLQGAHEFKNEIELLSRIHHKNVVKLEGFCYEQGEQMLVYEYIPNGNLRESISGTSGVRLTWMRRLKVALDSAGGIAYLHEQADPPVIHRDIKSNNILLDAHLNGKVADFGLSKLMGDSEKGYVTTQVKGTMGYMDPEYYMTQQLTEKSDVFSFGIVLLELITARKPIQAGRYIVKEVQDAMGRSKVANDYREIVDPAIDSVPIGLEKLLELAMRCVRDSGADRPTMGEVVREIENIVKFADSNPNSSSAYTTSEASTNNYFGDRDLYGPSDESLNNYRGNNDLFSYTAGR